MIVVKFYVNSLNYSLYSFNELVGDVMDKLFSSKIYINHRFKLIMVLDLLTVIFGVVASIFLGKASDPFSMLNDHYIEIIEFLILLFQR